jgi:hypothetical protein
MKRAILRTLFASAALVGLIGLMHLPLFRPFLMSLAGCPFPSAGRLLSPEEAEELRVSMLAPRHANARAESMPALGFSLGTDDRPSIAAWAQSHGIACSADAHGSGLRCADVPGSALRVPVARANRGLLSLGFDARDRLVSVQYALDTGIREHALDISQAAQHELARAGSGSMVHESSLASPLAQRKVELALADFRGEVTATSFRDRYVVTQSYQSFPR